MELDFIIRKSALKRNLDEDDIRHVFKTCRYMGQYENRENVYLLLGFDTRANPVEILYNEFGKNGVNVFHAMPCRDQYLPLFEEGGMP